MDQQRTETGPVQFGDDWPGVFLRGDDALAYALLLRNLIQRLEQDPDYKREAFEGIFQLAVLRDLRDLLQQSFTMNKESYLVQRFKPYADCKVRENL